jgi:hypothetical protein
LEKSQCTNTKNLLKDPQESGKEIQRQSDETKKFPKYLREDEKKDSSDSSEKNIKNLPKDL